MTIFSCYLDGSCCRNRKHRSGRVIQAIISHRPRAEAPDPRGSRRLPVYRSVWIGTDHTRVWLGYPRHQTDSGERRVCLTSTTRNGCTYSTPSPSLKAPHTIGVITRITDGGGLCFYRYNHDNRPLMQPPLLLPQQPSSIQLLLPAKLPSSLHVLVVLW